MLGDALEGANQYDVDVTNQSPVMEPVDVNQIHAHNYKNILEDLQTDNQNRISCNDVHFIA